MATMNIVTQANKQAGTIDLDPAIFEAPVRPHLFHAEVRRQLAERRAGTHSTKNRTAVSGGGAKPYRQKGTGRARQGTNRAPQFAGGGVVFGPVPRGHGHKLTKKMRRAALISAISAQQEKGAITVVENLEFTEFKTRAVLETLESLGLSGQSVLIISTEADEKLDMSTRNLRGISSIRVEGVNVYDVLRHTKLLMTKDAVAALGQRLNKAPAGDAGEETSA
jgi:large subunit ribosomal protein L4